MHACIQAVHMHASMGTRHLRVFVRDVSSDGSGIVMHRQGEIDIDIAIRMHAWGGVPMDGWTGGIMGRSRARPQNLGLPYI